MSSHRGLLKIEYKNLFIALFQNPQIKLKRFVVLLNIFNHRYYTASPLLQRNPRIKIVRLMCIKAWEFKSNASLYTWIELTKYVRQKHLLNWNSMRNRRVRSLREIVILIYVAFRAQYDCLTRNFVAWGIVSLRST